MREEKRIQTHPQEFFEVKLAYNSSQPGARGHAPHCGLANGLERVRGRSHSPSSWRKSKSLAEARNLFAGSQVVTHGRLRAFASGL